MEDDEAPPLKAADDVVRFRASDQAGDVTVSSWDDEARTVEAVLYAGSTVRRPYGTMEVRLDGIDLRFANSGRCPVFVEHAPWLDMGMGQVGHLVEGTVRVEGARVVGRVRFAGDDAVAPLRSRVREGVIRNVSMGFEVLGREVHEQKNGSVHVVVTASRVFELSLVGVPADREAQTLSAHGRPGAREAGARPGLSSRSDSMEDDDIPGGAGTGAGAPAGGDAGASATPSEGSGPREALRDRSPDGGSGRLTEDERAELERLRAERRERERREAEERLAAQVRQVAADFGLSPDLGETWAAEGISVETARQRAQERFARMHRDAPGGGVGRCTQATITDDRGPALREAMAAAMTHAALGGDLPADAREFRGMRAVDMIRLSMERGGASCRGMTDDEIAGEFLAGGHSSSDFPLALGVSMDRSVRAGYELAPTAHQRYARRTSVPNFRAQKRISVGHLPLPKEIAEDGIIPMGTFGEKGEDIAVTERGRMIAVTRRMLVNDSLGALAQAINRFGYGIRQQENRLVVSALLSNPVMQEDGAVLFSTARNTLGATDARPSQGALKAGFKALRSQRSVGEPAAGDETDYIRAEPRLLVVGRENEDDARRVLAPITAQTVGDVNPYANSLDLVVDLFIEETSSEVEPWFIMADPNGIGALEYAYLNGRDAVGVEMRPAWTTTGMEYRILHDFGVAWTDTRGVWKNNGAAPV